MASSFVIKETTLTESGVAGSMTFDSGSCGFNLATIHAEHELWCDPVDGAGVSEGTVSVFNPLTGVFVDVTTSWSAGEMPIVFSQDGVFDQTGSRQSGVIRPVKIKVSWALTDGTSRVMLRSRITGY
jgi:hypothetical protein